MGQVDLADLEDDIADDHLDDDSDDLADDHLAVEEPVEDDNFYCY